MQFDGSMKYYVYLSLKSVRERQNLTTEINEILNNIRDDIEKEIIRVQIIDNSRIYTVHDLSMKTKNVFSGCLSGPIQNENADCGRIPFP